MKWSFSSDRAIYLQLVEQISVHIICSTYLPGEKLPSVRDMAQEAGVNPNTMQKALVELENTDIVFSKKTIGRFITEDTQKIKQMKEELVNKKTTVFFKEMQAFNLTKESIQKIIETL